MFMLCGKINLSAAELESLRGTQQTLVPIADVVKHSWYILKYADSII